jgi:peptidoglycan/LPS O-acetylase OafA/YrhL
MNDASKRDRTQPKSPRVAIAIGLVAAFITAGVVSWATPDGNLVVTLVPALAVGLVVFGLASWHLRRGISK